MPICKNPEHQSAAMVCHACYEDLNAEVYRLRKQAETDVRVMGEISKARDSAFLQVGELQKEREALRLMWESEREAVKNLTAEVGESNRLNGERESAIRRAIDKLEACQCECETSTEAYRILTTLVRPKGVWTKEEIATLDADAEKLAKDLNLPKPEKRVEPSQNHHAHNWAIYNPASVDDPRLICKDCGFIQYA